MMPLREYLPQTKRLGSRPQGEQTAHGGQWDGDDDCRRLINDHQWINFREGVNAVDDQLVIVDADTGARIVVSHESWSALVSAARYFNDVHCDVAGCGDEAPR